MGSVTISVKQKLQGQLNDIKENIPELKEYEGDTLAKKFFYYSVREAAALFAKEKE